MGFSETVCANRAWEGLGYSNYDQPKISNHARYGGDLAFSQNWGGNEGPPLVLV